MKHEPLLIEKLYDAPLERVWKAITEKDQMKEWYFNIPDFRPEVGAEFAFDVEQEGKTWAHRCRVTEVHPYRKISYTWRYEGFAGNSTVSFELLPEGDKTRLKLTHEGLETFPTDVPSLARTNFEKGWTQFAVTNLKDWVETEQLHFDVDIKASADKVWSHITDRNKVADWAKAFHPGTTVETDWEKGGKVVWKDGDGNIGAWGIIQEKDAPAHFKVRYYDSIAPTSETPLGEYVENYSLVETNGITTLQLTTGPLQRKYISMHEPMWKEAVRLLKEQAEG